MRSAIVVGGAGFTGIALTKSLRKMDYSVYNVIRPGSAHRSRLDESDKELHIIECALEDLISLEDGFSVDSRREIQGDGSGLKIPGNIDVMFYISWVPDAGLRGQYKNVGFLNNALDLASKIGCRRIVITGSQAEYGVVPKDEMTYEDKRPDPVTDYGAAKVASCYLSRQYAKDLGIEWIWGRIFSLIGKNEPTTRMLPALYHSLKEGRDFELSSCRQNWDYLDVHDAADALTALAERGKPGEIYNIANGDYRELRSYTEELRKIVNPGVKVSYGDDPSPFISLQPSVGKIYQDTGWKAKRSFAQSVSDYDAKTLDQ
ncbi:MAG: NAD(P)-dependent oxidoreductase [Lachnospiraceae bacterium]|nr:NAD(P)-dependent oxidoreductase [Lachnospiraceae bacterium]